MLGNTFIIAEIGQNHNGDMDLARKLVDIAAMPIFDKYGNVELPGANAVKFTKRDLTEELTVEEMNKPYNSPHSFGRTYGEHREKLEFSYEQHAELEKYSHSKGLKFIETLTSIKTISLLNKVDIDAIKVASRDLTNIPLLHELGKTKKKIIISTGMSGEDEIDLAINIISKYHDDISILHCISQYPASYDHLNLLTIPYLKEKYPYKIGFSDHSIGIVMSPVAVALGAEIIEKHITLNRQMKGSDHSGSLAPDGLWRMIRDIRNVEKAMGKKCKIVPSVIKESKLKLERSIATTRTIKVNETIQERDLCMLSPGNGLRWDEREKIIGKQVKREIPEHTTIQLKDIIDG